MGYITMETAAERLCISEKTMKRMVQRGAIPAYRIGPKMVRIDEKELEAYVRERLVAPKPARRAEPARACRYVPGMKVV